jgi:hypothetical protein
MLDVTNPPRHLLRKAWRPTSAEKLALSAFCELLEGLYPLLGLFAQRRDLAFCRSRCPT